MEKVIVKVKGMSCTGCENRIKNALSDIEGIKKVDANHKSVLLPKKCQCVS